MKIALTFLVAFLLTAAANTSSAQILAEANRCYEEKKYDCAIAKYIEAVKAKVHQEKDLGTIQYRIGFAYNKLDKQKEAVPFLLASIKTKPDWGSPVWELAYTYYELDSFTRSNEYYGKAITFYKNDTASLKRLYYWKGRAQAANKLYSAAITEYLEAYKIDSTTDYVISSLGDASYENKNYKDAKKYYARSVDYALKNNMDKDVLAARYYWYAQALHNLKEYKESEALFSKAMANGYEQRRIYWGLGGSNYNQKSYKESIEYYTKAIREFSGDSSSLKTLHYWRGKSYSGMNDYAKAQADFATAMRFAPNYFSAYYENANLLRKMKKHKDAIVAYDNALKKFSTSSYYDLADLHYGRGMCYLEMKDSIMAKSDFLFAVEYDYNMPDPNVQLGHMEFKKKNYSGARIHYGKISEKLEVDSSVFSFLYFRKGFANYLGGSTYYSYARGDFEKSLQYDSLNREARRYVADIYFVENKPELAEREMTRCIQLYAKDKDSLINMYRYRAQIRNHQKRYKEALEDYEQVNKLKPFTNVADIKYMGQMAFEIKDYNKAITHFTKISGMYEPTQKSDLLFAYYARGRCYYEQKKKANAVQDLQKALEYEPNNTEVKSWLTKAQQLP